MLYQIENYNLKNFLKLIDIIITQKLQNKIIKKLILCNKYYFIAILDFQTWIINTMIFSQILMTSIKLINVILD